MRPTGLLMIVSLATYGSAWLMTTGWRQPRPSLESSVRHIDRPAAQRAARSAPGSRSMTSRLGAAAVSTRVGGRATRWTRPLRLIGRTVPTHVGLLVVSALAGLIVPALSVPLMQLAGLISVGVAVPTGLGLVGMAAAPAALHSHALSQSAVIGIDLRHQLSAYLDMMTMLLAGNTGYEGALEQAARSGDGLLFRELRRRMREVATTGHSLIGALSLVGDGFGVVELDQVAAAATLSAAEGAPVARTLAAKCATLRSTLAAEQEANARVRNDKVTPPLVGMALLFMALLIYPALALN